MKALARRDGISLKEQARRDVRVRHRVELALQGEGVTVGKRVAYAGAAQLGAAVPDSPRP